jgi:hypothetical protein
MKVKRTITGAWTVEREWCDGGARCICGTTFPTWREAYDYAESVVIEDERRKEED